MGTPCEIRVINRNLIYGSELSVYTTHDGYPTHILWALHRASIVPPLKLTIPEEVIRHLKQHSIRLYHSKKKLPVAWYYELYVTTGDWEVAVYKVMYDGVRKCVYARYPIITAHVDAPTIERSGIDYESLYQRRLVS